MHGSHPHLNQLALPNIVEAHPTSCGSSILHSTRTYRQALHAQTALKQHAPLFSLGTQKPDMRLTLTCLSTVDRSFLCGIGFEVKLPCINNMWLPQTC